MEDQIPPSNKNKHKRSLSDESNKDVCSLINHEKITLSNEITCKIASTKVLSSSRVHPERHVFHTGTRSSLLREDIIERDWTSPLSVRKIPQLKCATNKPVEVSGTVIIYAGIKETPLWVLFGTPGSSQSVLHLENRLWTSLKSIDFFPKGRLAGTSQSRYHYYS